MTLRETIKVRHELLEEEEKFDDTFMLEKTCKTKEYEKGMKRRHVIRFWFVELCKPWLCMLILINETNCFIQSIVSRISCVS